MLFSCGLVQWVSPIVNGNDIKAYLVGGQYSYFHLMNIFSRTYGKNTKYANLPLASLQINWIWFCNRGEESQMYTELLNIIADYVSVNNVEPSIRKEILQYTIENIGGDS